MSAKLKRVLIFLGILILLSSANMGFETHWKNPVGWILFGLGVLGTGVAGDGLRFHLGNGRGTFSFFHCL